MRSQLLLALGMAILPISLLVMGGQSPSSGVSVDPPVVSEIETLRLENLALSDALAQAQGMLQVCQGQLAPQTYQQTTKDLAAKRQQILTSFETAHPGWTLDPKTGAVTKK